MIIIKLIRIALRIPNIQLLELLRLSLTAFFVRLYTFSVEPTLK